MTMPPVISLIVAMAENRVIGRDGDLPWRLALDLKRFRERTTGHHVIMGRKTHESIGRPLPGRTNVVLSRNESFAADGCTVVRTLDDAFAAAQAAGDPEAFVIGGARVYESALPHAHRVYLTRVAATVEGDAYFPALDESQWREVSREEHGANEQNDHAFALTVLERA